MGAVCLALALAAVACGGGGDGDEPPVSGPRGLVESAGFDGVESGELEVTLEIDDQVEEEEINMRILGPFMEAGGEGLPQIDIALEAHGPLDGREIDFSSGVALLTDRLVVFYEDETYEPTPAEFQALRERFEEAQEEGSPGDVTACAEAAEGVEIDRFVDGFANEGRSREIDGAPVTRVSGDLDVRGAIGVLVEMSEDPGCGPQLEAVGLPPRRALRLAKPFLARALEDARVEFAVGRDGVLRNFTFHATARPRAGKRRGEIEIDGGLRLARVNEIESLPFPEGRKPLGALFERLGSNELEGLESGSDEWLADLLEALSP
ncbi:MAG: hypothetical protein M3335_04670 [Actinomycetota bacterium]|nr:hypothetical protein [Actinomycetota bacterium]